MSDAVTSLNALRGDWFRIQGGTCAHADATAADASPAAVDLPTLLTMANALTTAFGVHVASICNSGGAGAHGTDSGHAVRVQAATDLGSARVLLSDLQTALIDHAGTADGVHYAIALLDGYLPLNGGLDEACRWAMFVQGLFNAHAQSALSSQVAA